MMELLGDAITSVKVFYSAIRYYALMNKKEDVKSGYNRFPLISLVIFYAFLAILIVITAVVCYFYSKYNNAYFLDVFRPGLFAISLLTLAFIAFQGGSGNIHWNINRFGSSPQITPNQIKEADKGALEYGTHYPKFYLITGIKVITVAAIFILVIFV